MRWAPNHALHLPTRLDTQLVGGRRPTSPYLQQAAARPVPVLGLARCRSRNDRSRRRRGAGGVPDFGGGVIGSGGGGAGGNVVLQGMMVEVTGRVFANGGGGGAGSPFGHPGQDGTRSATVSAEGGTVQTSEGVGGAGGRDTTGPGAGGAPTNAGTNTAGAAGSCGFIQTYTPAGKMPLLFPEEASPSLEDNLPAVTR